MQAPGILTRFGTASNATKAGILTAALMALTAGAGFANELPAPAQALFDEVVGADDDTDGQDEGVDEGSFGERVSQDATGESDGEPGVDGRVISCEASEGRAAHCDDAEDDAEAEDDGNAANDFGERVSQDATGASDGEPGVDGEQISQEARARGGEDATTEDGDDDAEGEDDGEGRPADAGPAGTPGEGRGRPSDG